MEPRTNTNKEIFNGSEGIKKPKTVDTNKIFDISEKYFEIISI